MFNVAGKVEIHDGKIVAAYQGTKLLDEAFVSDTEVRIPSDEYAGRWDVNIFNINQRNTVARIAYFYDGCGRAYLRYREILPLQENGTLLLGSVGKARYGTFFRPAALNGLCEDFYQEFGRKIDASVAEFGPDVLARIYQKAEDRELKRRLMAMGITHTCDLICEHYECDWDVSDPLHKRYTIVVASSKVNIVEPDDNEESKIYYQVPSSARWVIVAEYLDNGVNISREVCLEAPSLTPTILNTLERFLDKHAMSSFLDLLDDGYYFVPMDDRGRPLPTDSGDSKSAGKSQDN